MLVIPSSGLASLFFRRNFPGNRFSRDKYDAAAVALKDSVPQSVHRGNSQSHKYLSSIGRKIILGIAMK
jgi:hypothetical protein